MQKVHIFRFVRSASIPSKHPPEPPLNKKPEHAQIRMHHHCTSIRVWLVTRLVLLTPSTFIRTRTELKPKIESVRVVYVHCVVWSSEMGCNGIMNEIKSMSQKLSIRVSYVSVTKSTQATSPWAGSLVQEKSLCVLSLMTLSWLLNCAINQSFFCVKRQIIKRMFETTFL